MMESKKQIAYQRYLSFDLNTNSVKFNNNMYSQMKSFLVRRDFVWLKDSNYKSNSKLLLKEIRQLETQFIKTHPTIAAVLTKFDWTAILSKEDLHRGCEIAKKANKILEKESKKFKDLVMSL
ncbi:MAG: hypothetical protein Ta2E_08210 [Mycoplasmoidaceae bacterium]|nr:MAG: hypothetical protein Ta2E_08210 [Mycoplasmoidaceae bacterium]